jgi:hypothetical protein
VLEALCRQSSTTLDIVHAEDGPPITQRTSGLEPIGSCIPARSASLIYIAMANTGRRATGGIDMRHLVLAAIVAVGLGSFMGIGGVSAAPANGQAILQSAENASSISDVAAGCGRGWHRDRWGRCVP